MIPMQPPLLPHERVLRIGVLAALGLALGLLLAKAAGVPLPGLPCGFRNLSGLPCAMCGGTRAVASVLEGEWCVALYGTAMAIPGLAGLVGLAGICLAELWRGSAWIDWNPFRKRIGGLLPLTLALLTAWWALHVVSALKTPKPELVDLRNPVAAAVADWFGIR
jgi:hypothetical protein